MGQYLDYARSLVSLAEQCLKHGAANKDDVIRWIDDALSSLREVHRDLELALEELLSFRERVTHG